MVDSSSFKFLDEAKTLVSSANSRKESLSEGIATDLGYFPVEFHRQLFAWWTEYFRWTHILAYCLNNW